MNRFHPSPAETRARQTKEIFFVVNNGIVCEVENFGQDGLKSCSRALRQLIDNTAVILVDHSSESNSLRLVFPSEGAATAAVQYATSSTFAKNSGECLSLPLRTVTTSPAEWLANERIECRRRASRIWSSSQLDPFSSSFAPDSYLRLYTGMRKIWTEVCSCIRDPAAGLFSLEMVGQPVPGTLPRKLPTKSQGTSTDNTLPQTSKREEDDPWLSEITKLDGSKFYIIVSPLNSTLSDMSNFRKAVSENGQYRFDFAAPSTDISITPFGIIVYGKAAEANAAVWRINANGLTDPTSRQGGKVRVQARHWNVDVPGATVCVTFRGYKLTDDEAVQFILEAQQRTGVEATAARHRSKSSIFLYPSAFDAARVVEAMDGAQPNATHPLDRLHVRAEAANSQNPCHWYMLDMTKHKR